MTITETDILIMSDNSLNTVGGEQESTKIIINGLKNKYNLAVIQPGLISDLDDSVAYYELTKQTRLKHLIKNPVAFICYIWKIRSIINKIKPTIIHTQSQVSFFIVALLKKNGLISKKHYLIHTERGLYDKYSKFIKGIFFFFMKGLDTLVTTTEFNMNYWKTVLEQKEYSIQYKVIENTAGEIFGKYDETYDNKNYDKLIIGFAGRYATWKNWPLAVEISKKLNDVIGEKLEIKMAVGCLDEKSLEETQIMFRELKELLGERFDGSININLEKMNEFYYDIDIFILTSDHNTESFGRTLVEAMSRKTVVLTTDAGGSVEVVGDLDSVHRNADEFVNKTLEFFYDKDLMFEVKERNFRRVNKVYSLKNNLSKHIRMYEEIKNAK